MITEQDCLDRMSALGIVYELVRHKAVYTIEEAMAELPDRTEIKNLFISDDKGKKQYLVIMPGTKKLDLKQLAIDLGEKKVRFVGEKKMMNMLGVKPGSVSLFCCLNPNSSHVKIVLDKELIKLSELGFHPIVNTATVYISSDDTLKLIDSLSQDSEIIQL